MDITSKRNKIILSLVILGTVLLFIVIVTIAICFSLSPCKCTVDIPANGKLQTAKSPNNRALVKFSGYLIYTFEDKTLDKIFMPLEMESVGLISLCNNGEGRMDLYTNCTDLTFNLDIREPDISGYYVYEIHINLKVPNGINKACTAVMPSLEVGGSLLNHYACYKERVYDCYHHYRTDKQEQIVKLVVQALEFEVDGDVQNTANERFSTPAKNCSTLGNE